MLSLLLFTDGDRNDIRPNLRERHGAVDQTLVSKPPQRLCATDPPPFPTGEDDDGDPQVKNSFKAAITRTIASP